MRGTNIGQPSHAPPALETVGKAKVQVRQRIPSGSVTLGDGSRGAVIAAMSGLQTGRIKLLVAVGL